MTDKSVKKGVTKLTKAEAARQALLAQLEAEEARESASRGEARKSEDFSVMFEASLKERDFNVGDVVLGRVLEVNPDFVLVDINYKSEGLIPFSEFHSASGAPTVMPGDEIQVYIDKVENDNGMVVLSKDKADMLKAWNEISQACEREELVEGTVIAKVKGGLSVDIGVKAFLPGSQIDLRPVRNLDQFIGKRLKFKVIKFNKKRGNIVLSRRALLEKEREHLKHQTLETIREGQIVDGIVKNITDYGAFIDLGGMDGLLHITDMSWGRVKHPSQLLNVGDEIKVKVLKYDTERERVSLGLKQLQPDPWENVPTKFVLGQKLSGKVVSLADYGAFVEIEEGVEGLIHVSEMSWTQRVRHPSKIVNVDDKVDVVVLDIDVANRRISLGMKQLEANPWQALKEKYPPGTIIEGQVKSVTDFGIFIGIEEGIDGLVHISDMSWTKRPNHPSEVFKKGDSVKAVVLAVDMENERFSLGIKQLEKDPWADVSAKYVVGLQLDVKVTKLADFGVFVELEPEVEGLIHISELSPKRIDKVETFCKPDDIIRAEVISIDREARKIGLSAKAIVHKKEREEIEKNHSRGSSKTSLGDIFGDQLSGLKKESGEDQ